MCFISSGGCRDLSSFFSFPNFSDVITGCDLSKNHPSPVTCSLISPQSLVSKTVCSPVHRWDYRVCVCVCRVTESVAVAWWSKRVHLMWQGSETVGVREGSNDAGLLHRGSYRTSSGSVTYHHVCQKSTGCILLHGNRTRNSVFSFEMLNSFAQIHQTEQQYCSSGVVKRFDPWLSPHSPKTCTSG